MSESLAAVVVGLVGLAGAVLTAFITGLFDNRKSVADQYQALVDDIQDFASNKAVEQDKKIKVLTAKLEDVQRVVAEQGEQLRVISSKYDLAIGFIRRAHQDKTVADLLPPLPERLLDDVRRQVS